MAGFAVWLSTHFVHLYLLWLDNIPETLPVQVNVLNVVLAPNVENCITETFAMTPYRSSLFTFVK